MISSDLSVWVTNIGSAAKQMRNSDLEATYGCPAFAGQT